MLNKPIFISALFVLLSGLTACGGGGSSDGAASGGSSNAYQGSVLPHVSVTIPAASYAAGSAELGGWTVLQQARVLCGFGALTQNSKLDAAARLHARYLTSISIASGVSELTHYETVTADPFYTGYSPWDRTNAQGYGYQVAEILEASVWDYDISNPPVFPTMEQRGVNSMRSLMNTVYHLSGAMYDGAEVGFGADIQTKPTGSARHEEYRFGSINGYQNASISVGNRTVVTYPCQGSTDIPSSFIPANESPNPFPSMTSTSPPVGPPIYIKVDHEQVLVVTTHSVVRQDGTVVPSALINNSNDPAVPKKITYNEAFVIPSSALSPGTTYNVSIEGTVNGAAFKRSFAMSTAASS
jgi:hypothetical protein